MYAKLQHILSAARVTNLIYCLYNFFMTGTSRIRDACVMCLFLRSYHNQIHYHTGIPCIKCSVSLNGLPLGLSHSHTSRRSRVSEIYVSTVNLTPGICRCDCIRCTSRAVAIITGFIRNPDWHIRKGFRAIGPYFEVSNSLKNIGNVVINQKHNYWNLIHFESFLKKMQHVRTF